MSKYPGRLERETARALIDRLPDDVRSFFEFDSVDLLPAAEHVLYNAIRKPMGRNAPSAADSVVRLGVRSLVAVREAVSLPSPRDHGGIAVLVTQPVHVVLFQPVADVLAQLGERRPILVAARTGAATHRELSRLVDGDFRGSLRPARLGALFRYGITVTTSLRRGPPSWADLVARADAHRLLNTLRAALPRLALDVLRVQGLIEAARPRVIACFSESGVFDRVTTATGARAGVPVVDLPHAEAADPWGTAGVGYDAMAVYGPRAASVLELAGVPRDRIVHIGPLRYDRLVGSRSVDVPHRILFASQPVDPDRPHLSELVKRLAIESAMAFAVGANAGELILIPHPTEDRPALDRLTASLVRPDAVRVLVDPAGTLHDRLPGAFALVTASSQSAFEAVVAGVPAVTFNPPGVPPPVAFAEEGIALAIQSANEARALGARLLDASEREAAVRRARAALDVRIGPIDGHAAERAARWLHGLGR